MLGRTRRRSRDLCAGSPRGHRDRTASRARLPARPPARSSSNICSVQSELARPGIAPYAATKGALKMLTKGLCADLAPHGVQVTGLAPGYFDTELTAALVADTEFSAWVARRTPAGRWGRLDDLVGALVFLCGGASDFVNGQILHVDGGMTAVL